MKQRLAEDRARAAQHLQQLYAPVGKELAEVEESLLAEFRSDDHFIDRLAQHGRCLGGKRLRPALVLLSGRACGQLLRAHVDLATVLEMIHAATLLHDDVLDEATLRRHLDTVNARWDNEASILLGDFLLARAIERVAAMGSCYAMGEIATAARTVCEGELRQVHWRGNFDLTEEDYLRIIADKTAALTSCSCRLGAHFSGASRELCDRFARFGQLLGVAFQIVDDLLDVLGDEATVGKSLGTDLVKQKATLPLIRLLGQVSAKDRQEILTLLNSHGDHRRELQQSWYRDSNAIEYSYQQAIEYARRASQELQGLTSTTALETLQALTDFVVDRHE
jgi:octaprenyl-diphosphate synthase